MDGGVRRRGDVVKALALGARAVLIGRAYLWGSALTGRRAWRMCSTCCVPGSTPACSDWGRIDLRAVARGPGDTPWFHPPPRRLTSRADLYLAMVTEDKPVRLRHP